MDEVTRLEKELLEMRRFETDSARAQQANLERQIREALRVMLLAEATMQDGHAKGFIPGAHDAARIAEQHIAAYRALAEELRQSAGLPPASTK